MVVYRDVFQPLAVFHKFKSFSLTFSFIVACSVIFSQYPNLHNSYVNCFIDSFNCKRDASSVLMEYCPEPCIWKVKNLCINDTWNSLLIHGFSLVNARLLKGFGTAFYAIILYRGNARLIFTGVMTLKHFFSSKSCLRNSPRSFQWIVVKPSSYCSHDLKRIILYRGHLWPLFTRVMALCQF